MIIHALSVERWSSPASVLSQHSNRIEFIKNQKVQSFYHTVSLPEPTFAGREWLETNRIRRLFIVASVSTVSFPVRRAHARRRFR